MIQHLLSVINCLIFLFFCTEKKEYSLQGKAQGTTYLISYVSEINCISQAEIDSVFQVIDLSLSLYKSNSLINEFNTKGEVKMDQHMSAVVETAQKVSSMSEGAFDITVKPLVDFWTGNHQKWNDKEKDLQLKQKLNYIGYKKLKIDHENLKSSINGMQIDCNGIAQGYTVDVLSEYLGSKGISDFLVEVGGEIRCRGYKINGSLWRIGLEAPPVNGFLNPVQQTIELTDLSITSAGNYRKYVESKGKINAHIIDPLSGYPTSNGIVSVTVIAHTAMDADAWDDVFFIKGVEWTQNWLKKNNFLELRLVYEDKKEGIKVFYSKGFPKVN